MPGVGIHTRNFDLEEITSIFLRLLREIRAQTIKETYEHKHRELKFVNLSLEILQA